MRLDMGLRKMKQDYIIKKFDQLHAAELPHLLKNDHARSDTPAWHLGVWSITSAKPQLTTESCNDDPAVAAAVDGFLGAIQHHIVPMI
jgi:hypothetical protein